MLLTYPQLSGVWLRPMFSRHAHALNNDTTGERLRAAFRSIVVVAFFLLEHTNKTAQAI